MRLRNLDRDGRVGRSNNGFKAVNSNFAMLHRAHDGDLDLIERRRDDEPLHALFRHGFQPYALPNPRHRRIPHAVRLFALLAIRKALIKRIGHLNAQPIAALLQDAFGHIGKEGQIAALVPENGLSVETHLGDLINRAEMQKDPLSGPRKPFRQRKAALIFDALRNLALPSGQRALQRIGDLHALPVGLPLPV